LLEKALAGFLRFTRDEYESIARASRSLPPCDSSRAFQRALSDALRDDHASLAERIAGLPTEQVRLIREHLQFEAVATMTEAPAAEVLMAGEAGYGLSFQEWRILSQVCALLFLFSDTPLLCKEALVRRIGEEAPSLAEKLADLDDEQIMNLYRRAKSGRRWCP
jgi:hypothetical protein